MLGPFLSDTCLPAQISIDRAMSTASHIIGGLPTVLRIYILTYLAPEGCDIVPPKHLAAYRCMVARIIPRILWIRATEVEAEKYPLAGDQNVACSGKEEKLPIWWSCSMRPAGFPISCLSVTDFPSAFIDMFGSLTSMAGIKKLITCPICGDVVVRLGDKTAHQLCREIHASVISNVRGIRAFPRRHFATMPRSRLISYCQYISRKRSRGYLMDVIDILKGDGRNTPDSVDRLLFTRDPEYYLAIVRDLHCHEYGKS